MYDPIRGERVTLRQPVLDDAAFLAALANEEAVARFTTLPSPYRLEHALGFIVSLGDKPTSEEYAIELDGAFIGMMGLMNIDPDRSEAEVGYWLGKPYRGRGYASEALDLLIGRAFEGLGLSWLYAKAVSSNAASRGLLESRGFVFERFAHESIREGSFIEAAHYGLSRSAWKKGKKVGQRT